MKTELEKFDSGQIMTKIKKLKWGKQIRVALRNN